MTDLAIASILGLLIVIAGSISIELGISAAIIEIIFGVFGGNFLHIPSTPWLTFIASLGGILLTFLAGTEVNVKGWLGKNEAYRLIQEAKLKFEQKTK